ncbi:MAG: hypothetical protein ABIF71_11220 [Planctomycetota bacterium]
MDILTLSPIWLPDPGIGKFARLAMRHNPGARVLVQEFWLPNDEYVPVYPLQADKVIDHNAATVAGLRRAHRDYCRDMETYLCAINRRLGRTVLVVVPAAQASIALRERVIAGKVPGIRTQADLFSDS